MGMSATGFASQRIGSTSVCFASLLKVLELAYMCPVAEFRFPARSNSRFHASTKAQRQNSGVLAPQP